ncbi:MAG: hypothetical protein ACO3UU_04295, partial [Minisyncoccia bacterium]
KADEIFTNYYNLIQDQGGELGQEILVSILARQCAKYAVGLLVKETLELSREYSNNFIYIYWVRVQEELEKM